MEVIARKEHRSFWVVYICALCTLAILFATAMMILIWHVGGWTVLAWSILVLLIPVSLPWGTLIMYLRSPEILAEFDGQQLYLYGREKTSISHRKLRDATFYQANGSLLGRCVIVIVTADKKKYKIKYAKDPSAVCERLAELARV